MRAGRQQARHLGHAVLGVRGEETREVMLNPEETTGVHGESQNEIRFLERFGGASVQARGGSWVTWEPGQEISEGPFNAEGQLPMRLGSWTQDLRS